jgi:hypothetical protein
MHINGSITEMALTIRFLAGDLTFVLEHHWNNNVYHGHKCRLPLWDRCSRHFVPGTPPLRSVPDGGATLALLGCAFVGIGIPAPQDAESLA